jgi:hypothetical protein
MVNNAAEPGDTAVPSALAERRRIFRDDTRGIAAHVALLIVTGGAGHRRPGVAQWSRSTLVKGTEATIAPVRSPISSHCSSGCPSSTF